MTKEKIRVLVTWLGQKAIRLPTGSKYITVARFTEDDNWEQEAWSIVIEFSEAPNLQGNPSKGMAYFLAENAPIERLKSGSSFEMYEGKNQSAEVQIL